MSLLEGDDGRAGRICRHIWRNMAACWWEEARGISQGATGSDPFREFEPAHRLFVQFGIKFGQALGEGRDALHVERSRGQVGVDLRFFGFEGGDVLFQRLKLFPLLEGQSAPAVAPFVDGFAGVGGGAGVFFLALFLLVFEGLIVAEL